jgi:DNA repair exonuclease SbcCD ATPase subunit
MINQVEIINFQSLKRAQLDLGAFTVIVGPSSSGKSALLRAFRALAANMRGTTQITRGQKQLAIKVVTDTHVITLERGERSSAYRLHGPDGEQTFTKLGGEVPQAVSAALRLDPGPDSINFASQFDKPYLLDESGSSVANQLAQLTKVDVIFEAVRSANRIRANAWSTLKTRRADLDAVKTRMADFQGLPDALRAFESVERAEDHRQALLGRIGRLETSLKALRLAERSLEKARPRELPDTADLTALIERRDRLEVLLYRWAEARHDVVTHQARRQSAAEDAAELNYQRKQLLKQAGVCPTCHQQIT